MRRCSNTGEKGGQMRVGVALRLPTDEELSPEGV